MHKDKFSWSRCSTWYVLQYNCSVKDSVYKQGKNYHSQVYVEECKYNDAENQQCNTLSDDDDDDHDHDHDDGFFGV